MVGVKAPDMHIERIYLYNCALFHPLDVLFQIHQANSVTSGKASDLGYKSNSVDAWWQPKNYYYCSLCDPYTAANFKDIRSP